MAYTPPPRGLDRESIYGEPFKPIRSERQAQAYGSNIHSIEGARDRRDEVIWSIHDPDPAA